MNQSEYLKCLGQWTKQQCIEWHDQGFHVYEIQDMCRQYRARSSNDSTPTLDQIQSWIEGHQAKQSKTPIDKIRFLKALRFSNEEIFRHCVLFGLIQTSTLPFSKKEKKEHINQVITKANERSFSFETLTQSINRLRVRKSTIEKALPGLRQHIVFMRMQGLSIREITQELNYMDYSYKGKPINEKQVRSIILNVAEKLYEVHGIFILQGKCTDKS